MLFYNLTSLHNAHQHEKKFKLAKNQWQHMNTDLLYSSNDSNPVQQLIAYLIIGAFLCNIIYHSTIDGITVNQHNMIQLPLHSQLINSINTYIHTIISALPTYFTSCILFIINSISYTSKQLVEPSRVLLHGAVLVLLSAAVLYIIFSIISRLVDYLSCILFGLPVYLVDFTTFNAPEHWKVPFQRFRTIAEKFGFKGMVINHNMLLTYVCI